jgi:hypothetical protein
VSTVAGVTAVNVARLLTAVGVGVTARRVTTDTVLAGLSPPDALARTVLRAGVFSIERTPPAVLPARGAHSIAAGALRLADAHYEYLWGRAHSQVVLIRDLSRLAGLAAILVTLVGFLPEWSRAGHFGDGTAATTIWLAGNFLLGRLSAGVALSTVLFLVALTFDGALRRRRAGWRLLYEVVNAELSQSDPQGDDATLTQSRSAPPSSPSRP